jgi:threonine/homoserine/homoserine lactone efflux protein
VLFLLKGAVLGFLIAAPVGPIGLLCITRTLRSGWAAGFASGLGAATADAAYGAVAALGIRVVISALSAATFPFHLASAGVLCLLGVQILRSHPRADAPSGGSVNIYAAYGSTLLLTILNPATILSFLALFGTIAGVTLSTKNALELVAGVFFGSSFWWLALTTILRASRKAISTGVIHAINATSGLLLIAFGAYALIGAFRVR